MSYQVKKAFDLAVSKTMTRHMKVGETVCIAEKDIAEGLVKEEYIVPYTEKFSYDNKMIKGSENKKNKKGKK